MKAILKSYRQAPRKVRLVTDLIKGKTVDRALAELDHLGKRAAGPIKKLLLSAAANAKENSGIETKDLLVKMIRVDQGVILKRSMPRARGSASPIHKHTSHVMLELAAHVEAVRKDVAPKAVEAVGEAPVATVKKAHKSPKATAKKVK